MMGVLDGVLMELQDCPSLLKDVITTDKEEIALKDMVVAILLGSMPKRDGTERKVLLKANVKIFKCQGAALKKYARKSVKVIVVGNPANTNGLIASTQYPDVNHAKVKLQGKEDGTYAALEDDSWLKGEFITAVQQCGTAVIKA
ncbi:Malate dehydrogenase, cytoplasmic, partial [Eschrichtius robustus]|nr:Malate dehydrogenase, cytoplasmic [Eschrichtius robustus]